MGMEDNGDPLFVTTKYKICDTALSQEIGKSGPHLSFHYGFRGREHFETYIIGCYILVNPEAFEWVEVTNKSVRGIADTKGVNLGRDVRMFACLIQFKGWTFSRSRRFRRTKLNRTGRDISVLPGKNVYDFKSPVFSWGGLCNDSIDDDHVFDLLCYKYVD